MGLRYGQNDKSNVKDSDLDSQIKKVYHLTHLKLVDKRQSVEVLAPSKDVTPVYNEQHVKSSVKAAQPHVESEPDMTDTQICNQIGGHSSCRSSALPTQA